MRIALMICGLGLASCALNTASSEDTGADAAAAATPVAAAPASGDGAVESTTEAVTRWVNGPYTWNQGDADVLLAPVATYVCVLSKVAGVFRGTGESVRVFSDGTFWRLTGSSAQTSVSGKAFCFPRSMILANGDTHVGYSPEYTARQDGNANYHFYYTDVRTLWGGAATVLSGLRGMGGSVYIKQSAGASPSFLTAQTGLNNTMYGYAHAFWFGDAANNGKLVAFSGPTGNRGDVTQIPELDASGNNALTVLAPVGNAFCYFTWLSGEFDGSGTSAEILGQSIAGTDYWVLQTKTNSNQPLMNASARCVARDQR